MTNVVFIQRHHADGANAAEYKQPRDINYRAIIMALANEKCDVILGVYSVRSTTIEIPIGKVGRTSFQRM
jgi:hypothetical protein